MGNSKSKEPQPVQQSRPDAHINAVGNMAKTINTMDKRIQLLDKKIDVCVQEAKAKLKKKDKKSAIFSMKKKKMYEKEKESLYNQRTTLEQQRIILESSSMTRTVVDTFKKTNAAMKNMQRGIDVDTVEDLKADIEDTMADANDITDAISQPIGDIYDEDELLQDLDDLVDEENELEGLEDDLPVKVPSNRPFIKNVDPIPEEIPSLPNVPKTAINMEEENELADLEAMMHAN